MNHFSRNGSKVKYAVLSAQVTECFTGEEYYRPMISIVWASGSRQVFLFDELLPDQGQAMAQAFARLGDSFDSLPPYFYNWECDPC